MTVVLRRKDYLCMRMPDGKTLDIWHAVPKSMGTEPALCGVQPDYRWLELGLILTCEDCLRKLERKPWERKLDE